MLAYYASICLEQLYHLINCQPDGLSIKSCIYLCQTIFCYVDNDIGFPSLYYLSYSLNSPHLLCSSIFVFNVTLKKHTINM